jgi:hypothetical protein
MLPPNRNRAAPDDNAPPRRRITVHTSNEPVTPEQLGSVREQHARRIIQPNLPPPQPQPRATPTPTNFDPRADFTRQQVNNSPRQPPRPSSTDNNETTMEDVAAAFARAGQPVSFRKSPPASTPAANLSPTQLADNLPSPDDVMHSYRIEKSLGGNPLSFREALPSNEVFYQHSALELRPFEVPEYAKLYRAREENDEGILFDTVDTVCSVDVRDLTIKDFRYLLYKLRINSSLKAPYKLSYTSAYGNRCEYTVNNTNLAVKVLEETAEEYAEWQAQGLTMPTLRDIEEYNGLNKRLGKEGEFLWSRAKYITGRNVEDKIAKLQKLPPDFLFTEIEQFAAKFEAYGVTESVQLQDNKFVPQEALQKLRLELARIDSILENQSVAVALANSLFAQRGVLTDDINRIEHELTTTGEAAPRSETITFSIEIADFFPTL